MLQHQKILANILTTPVFDPSVADKQEGRQSPIGIVRLVIWDSASVISVETLCRLTPVVRMARILVACLFFYQFRVLVVLLKHSISIAVRYCETDAMGFLHHSNYLNYFELGRTELFRAQGGSYRRMEELKMYFVVVKFELHYRKPARYDDQLTLDTAIARTTPARIEHRYELTRFDESLCSAKSTVACVGSDGQPMRIPENLAEITAVE